MGRERRPHQPIAAEAHLMIRSEVARLGLADIHFTDALRHAFYGRQRETGECRSALVLSQPENMMVALVGGASPRRPAFPLPQSLKYWRRSEWPRITWLTPSATSMAAEISPVKAPSSAKCIFWAPPGLQNL